jgi:nicotinic acid mononucleotide adenylyltransferase
MKFCSENLKGRDHFRDLGRWENIEMYLKEIQCEVVDWI